ncbi:site-specific integrase [Flavobacterium sp. SM15]|uniref:site-specific integrase n=1 Tax=Flavobacterium sp. SM15 TaxID=2908005 RepID=UPI001ED9DCDD|nr:site-specific integrase [Flavobacterium sp. SM15]MCG2610024.1 site-specific integrase [Flavobacterium sp. SM15]
MRVTTERSKGTVRFAFKEPLSELKRDKRRDSLLLMHFSYGALRFKYSTGFKVCFENWDSEKQRVRNKAGILDRDNLNDFLTDLENELNREVSRLISEQIPVTKEALKSKLDSFTNKNFVEVKDGGKLDFFAYAELFIELKKSTISIITIRSYRQTIEKLRNFSERYSIKVDFETFDQVFYNQFKKFLEEENFSQNTIVKHTKNLKGILNSAVSDGYNVNQKFKGRDFRTSTEQTTEIYLTDLEIDKILKLDLSKYKDLERARDIFLIGLSTGQRISDYNGLTASNIIEIGGREYFRIKQQKTGKTVNCLVEPHIRKIMNERYDGFPPAKMVEQRINDYLKQVGQMAGIDEKIVCKSTKGGKELIEVHPKYELIKTHTARRSFCTNKYKSGKSAMDIMFFSGHTTEREFYKYIRIQGEERASHLVDSGFYD